jgi:hypothetical protein
MAENKAEDPKQVAAKEQVVEHPKREWYQKPKSEKTISDQSGAGQAGVALYSSWAGGRER